MQGLHARWQQGRPLIAVVLAFAGLLLVLWSFTARAPRLGAGAKAAHGLVKQQTPARSAYRPDSGLGRQAFKAGGQGNGSVVEHQAAFGPAQGRKFVSQMRILSRLARVPAPSHRIVDTENIALRSQP